ncbi:MAG: L,D-transpeptidase family protein [Gammaproteobacteria bacterium]|nr:L,D-transpeptidase family protein [Gammaproteobacteria bacterium]
MKPRHWITIAISIACLATAGAVTSQQVALNRVLDEPELGDGALRLGDMAVAQVLERLEHRLEVYERDYEASLLKGLVLFKSGQVQRALDELDALTRRAPKFHLAHLVKADIQQSRLHVMSDLGASPLLDGQSQEQEEQLNRLREEANARLKAYLQTIGEDRVPAQMLMLGKSVKTAILVDKDKHRLYVYENPGPGQAPRLLRDFYVSTGKLIGDKQIRGDLKTPEGVYFVVSYRPDSDLPEKYGTGAFPLNYPNELDRRLGKTGYGIWLHGTDKSYYSRPPLDSEGCVVLTNFDLDAVAPYIQIGATPVVIAQQVEWLSRDEWVTRKDELLSTLNEWQRDWESLDVEQYLDNYASNFWSRKHDKKSWARYKRAVFSGKSYQRVEFDDVSMFAYPTDGLNGKPLVVVNFEQRYESNNFNSTAKKRVYLSKGPEGWKLVYEGGQ